MQTETSVPPARFLRLGIFCFVGLIIVLAVVLINRQALVVNAAAPAVPAGPPRFTSTGYVAVHLKFEHWEDPEHLVVGSNPAEVEVEQGTQVRLLKHGRLLSRVLESSEPIRATQWFKQFVSFSNGQQLVNVAAAKTDLLDHLEVTAIPKSRLIEVRMSCLDPKDAQTIVREIVDQHIKDQKEMTNLADIQRPEGLEQLKLNYESQIRDIASRMLRIATDLGSIGVGIGPGPDIKEFELRALISEQLKATTAQETAAAALKTFDEQMKTGSGAPELEEAIRKDAACIDFRHRVDELEEAADDAEESLGAKDPKSISAKHRLERMRKKRDDAESHVKSQTAERVRAVLQNEDIAASATHKRIDGRITDVRDEISALAKMRNEHDHLQGDLVNIRAQLDRVKDQQDRLGFLIGTGKWANVEWAALPDLPDTADKH